MHPINIPTARLAALVCLLVLAPPLQIAAQTYTITELPPLPGDTYCGAFALNESGQAAGYSADRAVIWTDGAPVNIHTLIASWSVAFALNDSGHAAGDVSTNFLDNSGAFIWRGSVMERIIPPSGQFISEAYAMNNTGVVVGPGGSATFGYRWQAGTFQSLGVLSGDHTARPLAINVWGQIAGTSISSSGRRPVTWLFTSAQPVPTPAGGTGYGQAWGINDLGAVVGEYYPGNAIRPFVSAAASGAIALPLPAGVTSGLAWAINDAGTIIGEAGNQPAIWRKNSAGAYEVALLATLIPSGSGWTNLTLYAINEAGQIAGEGRFNGQSRGFILNPGPSLVLTLRTDADRSGTTDFDSPADTTAPGKPFYFWTNDDHDATGTELPAGAADSLDARIMPLNIVDGVVVPQPGAIRDLEDFARLAFALSPDMRAALAAGATLALEARGAGTIQLFATPDADTETRHLDDESFARSLVFDPATNIALSAFSSDDGASAWKNLEQRIAPADWDRGRLRFLWEGVTPGACVLTLKLTLPDGTEIVSAPVHLSLRPVRDFFEHVRATPVDGFAPPYDTDGIIPAMSREIVHSQLVTPFGEQNVDLVWVHGWRLTKYERQNWAEMMFKRLWHAGYKGRLHAFTWPTLSGEDPLFESGPDGKLSYDRSEFRAWKSGAALEGYLHFLRNLHSDGRLATVSHSMGNVVTGEALRRAAPADLQIMMQAAISAGCYDTRTILEDADLLAKDIKQPTPDFDVDLGYRGFLENVAVPTINYFNEVDFALQTGQVMGFINAAWLTNQGTKPDDPSGRGVYGYRDDRPGLYSGKQLLREVTDVHESLAFLARSRTRAAGADSRIQFPQTALLPNVDLEVAFGFTRDSTEHSAQFNRPIQRELMPLYILIRRTVTTEAQ